MDTATRRELSLWCVWTACIIGLVHAAISMYWAVGGQWLLDTVGRWAVEQSLRSPRGTAFLLGLVALAKVAGSLVPVALATNQLRRPVPWRRAVWVAAVLLVLYGGANTAVAAAVLGGLVRPAGGYDRAAMIGHAWLWDPLFLLWGAALLGYLLLSRPRGRPVPS